MRSFAGRDILSLKDFERSEFFRVFEVADQLEPIARNRDEDRNPRCFPIATCHRYGQRSRDRRELLETQFASKK